MLYFGFSSSDWWQFLHLLIFFPFFALGLFLLFLPHNHSVSWQSLVEISSEVPGDRFEMHEVTEASSGAFPHLILPAAGLSEVSDGTNR